jgi:hypothetical protein
MRRLVAIAFLGLTLVACGNDDADKRGIDERNYYEWIVECTSPDTGLEYNDRYDDCE